MSVDFRLSFVEYELRMWRREDRQDRSSLEVLRHTRERRGGERQARRQVDAAVTTAADRLTWSDTQRDERTRRGGRGGRGGSVGTSRSMRLNGCLLECDWQEVFPQRQLMFADDDVDERRLQIRHHSSNLSHERILQWADRAIQCDRLQRINESNGMHNDNEVDSTMARTIESKHFEWS